MTEQRKAGWSPGQSGNPAGRPRGSGEVAKIRAGIAERIPEMIDAMMEKALSGDVGAARLLMERVVPPLKPAEEPQPLTLPDGTLTDQGRAVLGSVAAGELAPSQGAALLGAIGSLARLVEIDELAARVAALEKQHAEKA